VDRSIWIGFDPRDAAAFAVARRSCERHLVEPIPVHGLVLDDLRAQGLYWRPTRYSVDERGRRQMWDEISDAGMATEFAISRFLVPHLAVREAAGRKGWALFMDCDMLVRANLEELFASADSSFAVMCVKHDHVPSSSVKMAGQPQAAYPRKNWSSLMLFNCAHAANAALTKELVNAVPGRDLHRFCWLEDRLIGDLPVAWNWLAGYSDSAIEPKIVHHTDGSPCVPGFSKVPFAQEFMKELNQWAT
jgi:hypothetical protein